MWELEELYLEVQDIEELELSLLLLLLLSLLLLWIVLDLLLIGDAFISMILLLAREDEDMDLEEN